MVVGEDRGKEGLAANKRVLPMYKTVGGKQNGTLIYDVTNTCYSEPKTAATMPWVSWGRGKQSQRRII